MKTLNKVFFLAILLAGPLLASAGQFGYWRFENAGNLGADSSGNALGLASVNSPIPTNIIGSGPGSNFFTNGIPQTGQLNTLAVKLGGADCLSGTYSAFTNIGGAQFTAEAFINISGISPSTTTPIVTQWETPSGQKWALCVRQDSGIIRPRVAVSSAGNNAFSVNATALSLSLNTDYYIAVVFNNGNATFYVQNLSTPSNLQAETVATGLPGGLIYNAAATTNTPLRVGAMRLGASLTNFFNGFVDEVRVSTNAMGASELLVSQLSSPPTIIGQPQDQAVASGSTATFNVVASGSSPLYFLWYSNSSPATLLQAGTNLTSLVLSNTTIGQSGSSYFVIVTNQYGSATSAPPAVLTVVDVSSPTIGYWRCESSGNLGLNSSGSGLSLTNGHSTYTVGSYSLPDTNAGGVGAYFSKTIPLTSQTNTAAIELNGASYLTHVDWPSFTIKTQMTVEAYFNISSAYYRGVFNPIASQWTDPSNEGWLFGIKETDYDSGIIQLRFAFSSNGLNNWSQSATNWTLEAEKDYYAAVTVSNGIVTFYLADLSSTNPVVQSQSFTATVTNFYDSSVPFDIGARAVSTGSENFKGVIDEVRLSRVALAPTSLLYSFVPTFPVITQPPQNVAVIYSNNAVFTVAAIGQAPLSYQWYNAAGSTLILGATNTSLVLTNVTVGQSGNSYYVVVSNPSGQVASTTATLTVLDDTIGYWRFEDSGNLGLDSGSLGLQLTNISSPIAYTLPASGSGLVGAQFPKTIASTGQPNTGGVQLDGTASSLACGYSPNLALGTQFTIESFFNASSLLSGGVSTPIASVWNPAAADRSWVFAINGTGTNFQLRLGLGDGVGALVSSASWSLSTNRDYYAAAVFSSGTVKLYMKDLSSPNSVMQVQSFAIALTNIVNGSAGLRVGSYNSTGTPTNIFSGVLDEVRLSRVALLPQQLLIPAPATGVPANLAAVAGNTMVTLSWSVSSNAISYKLKRSTVNGGPYVVIPTSTSTLASTSYTDTNVVSGTTYYYVVAGVGAGGDSADSIQASATPVSVASSPTILPVHLDGTGTNLVLSVATESGHNYVLQSTPGLEGTPVWTPVYTNAGTGGPITNAIPINSLNVKEFYRYLVE